MKTSLTWAEIEGSESINRTNLTNNETKLLNLNYDRNLSAILEVMGFRQGDRILLKETEYGNGGDTPYTWSEKKDYYSVVSFNNNLDGFSAAPYSKSILNKYRNRCDYGNDTFICRCTIDSSSFGESTYFEDLKSIKDESYQDCVFLSIDVEYGPEYYKCSEFKTEYEAYYFLQSFLKPTLIMDNGHNLSAIYKLKERVPYNDIYDKLWRTSNLLAQLAKQDSDSLSSIFIRLPFKANHSYRRSMAMVNVAEYNPTCSYELSDLQEYAHSGNFNFYNWRKQPKQDSEKMKNNQQD